MDDYLTKPVDYDFLLATVDASIGQIKRIAEQNNKKASDGVLSTAR